MFWILIYGHTLSGRVEGHSAAAALAPVSQDFSGIAER
jgi:hypothetical protein